MAALCLMTGGYTNLRQERAHRGRSRVLKAVARERSGNRQKMRSIFIRVELAENQPFD